MQVYIRQSWIPAQLRMLGEAKAQLVQEERNRGSPVVLTEEDVARHRDEAWNEVQAVWPLQRVCPDIRANMRASIVSRLGGLADLSLTLGDEQELNVALILRQFDEFLQWLDGWWVDVKATLLRDWDFECDGPRKWRRFGRVDGLVRRLVGDACDDMKAAMTKRVHHIVHESVESCGRYQGPLKPEVTDDGDCVVQCADLVRTVSFWLARELARFNSKRWLQEDEFTAAYGIEDEAQARLAVDTNKKLVTKIVQQVIAVADVGSGEPALIESCTDRVLVWW